MSTNQSQTTSNEMITNQSQIESTDYLFSTADSSESLGSVFAYLKVNKHNKVESSYGEGYVLPSPVEVQIIDIVPNERRSFYRRAFAEAENKRQSPDCYSLNGQTPSARVANPQSTGCLNCPMNAWGSARANGLPAISDSAKGCKTHKRVIVVVNVPPEHELHGVLHVVSLAPKARDALGRVLAQIERGYVSYLNGLYKVTGQMQSMQFEFSKLISRGNAEMRRKLKVEADKMSEMLTHDTSGSDVHDALPQITQETSDQSPGSAALPQITQETSGKPPGSAAPAWVVEAD